MLYFKFHALKQDKEMKYTNVIKKRKLLFFKDDILYVENMKSTEKIIGKEESLFFPTLTSQKKNEKHSLDPLR